MLKISIFPVCVFTIGLLSYTLPGFAQNTPQDLETPEVGIAEVNTTSSSNLTSETTATATAITQDPSAPDLSSTASAAGQSTMPISGGPDQTTNTLVTTASSTMASADDPSTAGLTGESPTPDAEDNQTDDEDIQTSVTLPEGVIYQVTKPGTGEIASTTGTKLIHYTLYNTEGAKLESSRDAELPLPFQFAPGKGEAIMGMELGTAGMRIGEQRKIYVPARLGYGSKGQAPRIPPDTDLIFTVELVDLK